MRIIILLFTMTFLSSCAVSISTSKKTHDFKFQSPVKKVTTWKC